MILAYDFSEHGMRVWVSVVNRVVGVVEEVVLLEHGELVLGHVGLIMELRVVQIVVGIQLPNHVQQVHVHQLQHVMMASEINERHR